MCYSLSKALKIDTMCRFDERDIKITNRNEYAQFTRKRSPRANRRVEQCNRKRTQSENGGRR